MEEKTPLFKKMDIFLFQKLDAAKSTPGWLKFQEFVSSLDEEGLKLIKWGGILLMSAFPAILILGMFWQNSSLRNDLEFRQQIVKQAQDIISQNQQLDGFNNTMLGNASYEDQSAFSSALTSSLGGTNVDTSKLQVNNFNSEAVNSAMTRATADLRFTGLATEQLMNVFTNLMQRLKVRISAVSIKRNADTTLLDGNFSVVHLGRPAATEESEDGGEE